MQKITLSQQIHEVETEIRMREDVYARLDRQKPSGASQRAYRMDRMRAVLQTLEWLKRNETTVRTIATGPPETLVSE